MSRFLFCFLFILLLSTSAWTAEKIEVEKGCTQVGVSTMTTDQKNIVTCLKDDAGKLIWKSMQGQSSLWENVPLTDKALFNTLCEWRFDRGGYPQHGVASTSAWHYPIYVDPYWIHGQGFDIGHSQKGVDVKGNPVVALQKRCP